MVRLSHLALIALCTTPLAAQQGSVAAIYMVRKSDGWGGSPQDSLQLNANGDAHYYGERNVPRKGSWRGQIGSVGFDSLAAWLLPQLPPPTATRPPDTATGTDSARLVPLTVQATPACEDAPAAVIAAVVDGQLATVRYSCWPLGDETHFQTLVARFDAVVAEIEWAHAD
jgi:hypothetical protein